MAVPLKHVDLMLEENVVERLEEESRLHRMSLSDYIAKLLTRDLGPPKPLDPGLRESIEKLREEIGPMPDSTPLIRALRNGEW
ncbi:MAG TPA: hypothetical protein VE685_13985 [Thermoanaerobaculia bacterium]|nr:hypothetical protein [Thermoanaerobaculia bacterium]